MSVYAEALIHAAHRSYQDGALAEAMTALRLAVAAGGLTGYALYFLGHLHYLTGDLVAAEDHLRQALARDASNANAWNDLGETIRQQGRNGEAIPPLEQALTLKPDLAHAYGNLAAALLSEGRGKDALRRAEESLRFATDKAVAYNDLGSILGRLGHYDRAIATFDQALALRPGEARTVYYKSLLQLVLGAYREGWEGHEARLALPLGFLARRVPSGPVWRPGQDIAGRSILLHAEQGLGDTIQFARYAPLVAERGARVLLETQAGLGGLLSRLPGVAAVYEAGAALPAFDLECSLMSLPRIFATSLETIPNAAPYLAARDEKAQAWRMRLGWARGMRVAIAWAGNAKHTNDRSRSIPVADLAPLFALPGVEWHVAQPELRGGDAGFLAAWPAARVHADALTDFEETAGLLDAMDAVVTVDTALAHLAGAMGKRTLLLLPAIPDWRWLLDRADSPWYPTMRLFRQAEPGAWADVIIQVACDLGGVAAR
jgi:Flp pilus assembly protein TadD